MGDDGKGRGVKIPSFLISKKDGQILIDTIHTQHRNQTRSGNWTHRQHGDGRHQRNHSRYSRGWREHGDREGYTRRGHQVIIRASINLATKTAKEVSVDIWYSSIYEFLDSSWDMPALAQMQDIFAGKVRFQPRTLTRSCKGCSQRVQDNRCILGGKYCPIAPYGFKNNREAMPIDASPRELID